jgi:HEAT repeat protein
VPILPAQFPTTPVADLLAAAERGLVGFDRRLIETLIERRDETLAALTAYTTANHEDTLLDLDEQVFDLYRYFASPAAIPFYIRMLEKYPDDPAPDQLTEAFAALGAEALEPLLALLARSDADHQPDIAFLLAALGVHDARVRALIEKTLARDPYEGALCAGLNADPALRPALEAALAACPKAKEHEEERRMLTETLQTLDSGISPAPPEAYDILSEYAEIAMPLFDHLEIEEVTGFLDSPDPDYREQAAHSFAGDAYPDEVRDRLIQVARSDDESRVRAAALTALGERVDEPAVLALLLEALKAGGGEWRGALVGLAGATGEAEVHDAMVAAYQAEETRATALEAMWKSRDGRFKKFFSPSLQSDDPDVQRQAIQGVGAYGLTELAPSLIPFFEDEQLREEALFAYTLALDHHTTPKTVAKLYQRIDEKAAGLSDTERESVQIALDIRLAQGGFAPMYFPEEAHDHEHEAEAVEAPPVAAVKVGRNDPCPCGSGKKYKKCCGAA